MVIQCESCQTVYKIDKLLIKKTGTKVRCSYCSHEFMAFPEETVDAAIPKFPKATQKKSYSSDTTTDVKKTKEISESHEKRTKDILFELQSDLESIFEEVFRDSETQNASGDVCESAEEVANALKDIIVEEDGPASYPLKTSYPFDVLENPGKSKTKEKKNKSEKFEEQKAAEKKFKETSKKTGKKYSRGIRVSLIIVVLLLLGGFLAWSSGLLPVSILGLFQDKENAEPEKPGVTLLKVGSLKGRFINSSKNGPLFVVEGRVPDNFSKPSNRIQVRGTILDSSGNAVMVQDVYAGRTFSEEELNDLTMEEIHNASKNPNGMHQQDTEVLSGAGIPFMIVFVGLPDNMSEFKVEAVHSSAENK